jgi:hypothetical protein
MVLTRDVEGADKREVKDRGTDEIIYLVAGNKMVLTREV